MSRRLARFGTAVLLALGLILAGTAAPAGAVTAAQKLVVMSGFTQTDVASYNSWNSARQNQSAWAAYGFDWSTDYCTDSPDQPLGFDFRLSCHRHDWGYRNYKIVGQFPANKPRLDSALYADLQRVCATYNVFVRPACNALAWTYYQAVAAFGSLASVSAADLDRAATLKAAGEARAAKASKAR
jgi:hypothetical protein